MANHQRTPHPSPLQMLAILQARAEGLSAHEIHRRTGYSNMSVLRWFDAWGHDAKTLENLFRDHGIKPEGITFDDYFPKKQMAIPKPSDLKPTIQSGEIPRGGRFRTALGLK